MGPGPRGLAHGAWPLLGLKGGPQRTTTVPATPNSETSNSGTGISDPLRAPGGPGGLWEPLGDPLGALGAPRGAQGFRG